MSKPSHRPTREARKAHKQKVHDAQCQLHRQQAQDGLLPPRQVSVSNRLCPYPDEAEEQRAREGGVIKLVITQFIQRDRTRTDSQINR